jgi:hypothetical protein
MNTFTPIRKTLNIYYPSAAEMQANYVQEATRLCYGLGGDRDNEGRPQPDPPVVSVVADAARDSHATAH